MIIPTESELQELKHFPVENTSLKDSQPAPLSWPNLKPFYDNLLKKVKENKNYKGKSIYLTRNC